MKNQEKCKENAEIVSLHISFSCRGATSASYLQSVDRVDDTGGGGGSFLPAGTLTFDSLSITHRFAWTGTLEFTRFHWLI